MVVIALRNRKYQRGCDSCQDTEKTTSSGCDSCQDIVEDYRRGCECQDTENTTSMAVIAFRT